MKSINIVIALLILVQVQLLSQQQLSNSPVPFDPSVKSGTLPNGMVYVIKHNEKPENRVELRLVVKTGSTMENDDQQGLAHLIEHMAFNGTKHFAKSELVDYLESIGTAFGPHLNAYTSFDETVYMLQVPTDQPEFVAKGLQILEDWAHNLSFEHEEIDKERGVVIEEWRTRLGANERMRNVYWPVLYKDSRYGERLPIGKPEIIRNAPYEKLTSFYNDWYRPDNMAVMIVGDIDVAEMETMIKNHFSSIPNPANPKPVVNWDVKDHGDLRIVHATDKEATSAMIQIIYKHPLEAFKTESEFRKQLAIQLYNSLMASRLSELRKKSDPPFSFANTSFGSMVKTKAAFRSFAVVNDNGLLRGLETLITENERVKRHGFTETELVRAKKSMLRSYESAFNERNNTESSSLVDEYINWFLEGVPAPGIQYEFDFCNKYLDGITLAEINAFAQSWITDNQENCTTIITAPDKESVIVPTDAEVRALFEKIKNVDIPAYVDEVIDKPLIATLPSKGKIVSEEENQNFNFKILTLSNGAVVYLKKTDFKNDQVVMNALSFGGRSAYSEADDVNVRFSASIQSSSGMGEFSQVQLDKLMQGKKASVVPGINDFSESLSGSASPADLELWLQLLHLRFTSPRLDEEAFSSFITQQKTGLQNRHVDPVNAFRDTVQVTMSCYHDRKFPISTELIDQINKERALEIYKQRFSNAADWKFVFVGNFDEAQLRPLLEQYIASLPSSPSIETWKDMGVKTPRGKSRKVVKRGVEQKSMVQINYTGASQWTQSERLLMQAMNNLMQIKLRESLREDESGTYGVGCNGAINRIPNNDYNITISFQCDPANTDKLITAAFEVINNVRTQGCGSEDLTKITEGLKRSRETSKQENNFWVTQLSTAALYGDLPVTDEEFELFIRNLTSDVLREAANRYYNDANRLEFILLPE